VYEGAEGRTPVVLLRIGETIDRYKIEALIG
jgi:hypothetical protein